MKILTSIFSLAIIISLSLTVTHLASAEESSVCNKELRIGIITGLSGVMQSWGESLKNGFEMGLTDAGCQSMVRYYEDDQFDSKKTIAAYQKLRSQQNINLLILSSSNAGNVVGPLSERDGIPTLAWASDTNVTKDKSLVIRTWSSSKDEADLIAQTAGKLGYKRIAAFTSIHDYSLSVTDNLEPQISSKKFVLRRELPPEAMDFKAELVKLRAGTVDAVYNCLITPGATGVFTKQLREIGITVPVFGCSAMELQGNFASSDKTLNGAWYVTGGVQDKFKKRYTKLYGEPGTIGGAAMHYEIAKVLSQTSSQGEQLVQEILSTTKKSEAVEKLYTFKSKDDQALKLKQVLRTFTENGEIR